MVSGAKQPVALFRNREQIANAALAMTLIQWYCSGIEIKFE